MTPLAAARREAEEALAHHATCPGEGRWRECSSSLASALRALLAAARSAESALAEERRRREEAEGKFDLMAGPFFALAAELMPPGSVDEARTNPAVGLPYLEAWFGRLKEAEERSAALKAAPAQPAPLPEAARQALAVLTRLADSAAYWSEYDVPIGIVSEIDSAKARLAGVLHG